MASTHLRDFRPRIVLNVLAVAYGAILIELYSHTLVEAILTGAGLTAAALIGPLRQSLITGLPLIVLFEAVILYRLRGLHRIVQDARADRAVDTAARREARAVLSRLPNEVLVLSLAGFFLGSALAYGMRHGFGALASMRGVFVIISGVAFGGLWAQLINAGNDLILTEVRRVLKVYYIEPELGDKVRGLVAKRTQEMGFLAGAFFFYGLNFAYAVVEVAVASGGVPAAQMPRALLVQLVTLAVIAVVYTTVISRSQVAQLRAAKTRLSGILAGSTNAGGLIEISDTDEVGELVSLVNRFTEMQRAIVKKLTESSRLVAAASRRLDQAIQQVSAGAEQLVAGIEQVDTNAERRLDVVTETKAEVEQFLQSSNRILENLEGQTHFVDETSSAVSEMAANIRSVSQSSGAATQLAQDLSKVAHERGSAVQETIAAIQQIHAASTRVNEIVTVISKISAQTNMLAMNAAIEAAHAGDAGRGFAVVAEEVRSLATGSSNNAKQINALIRDMVKQVEQGVSLSTQAGEALQNIEEGVRQTTDMIQQISEAMREQSAGTAHILESIQELVQASSGIKEEALGQGRRNNQMRERIEQIVGAFQEIRVATREQSAGSREILAAVSSLREVAAANAQAVQGLEQLLAKMS